MFAGGCCVVLAAVMVGAPPAAQNVPVTEAPAPLARLLDAAAAPRMPVDYTEVFRVLAALSGNERKEAMRKLIGGRNDYMTGIVAGQAMREGYADMAGLIASRAIEMGPGDQAGFLEGVTHRRDLFAEIPRALLRWWDTTEKTSADAGSRLSVIGLAAMVLASMDTESDKPAVLGLAQSAPSSGLTWIAIARARAMNPAAARLARRVYRDEANETGLRVAAAAALQEDPEARRFAASQVESFLRRFADRPSGYVIGPVLRAEPAGTDSRDFGDLLGGLNMLSILMVMNDEDASRLTTQYVGKANELTQMVCATVAVLRWPKKFLELDQSRFADGLNEQMLALLEAHHPEDAVGIESRTTRERLERARQQVHTLDARVAGGPFMYLFAYLVAPPK